MKVDLSKFISWRGAIIVAFISIIVVFFVGLYNSIRNTALEDGYTIGYLAGMDDIGTETLKHLSKVANDAKSDTTKVQCLDFMVNKDTIHVQVWSKSIRCKNFTKK